MTVFARASIGRSSWACILAATALVLEACSGSSSSPVTGPIGTTTGAVHVNTSTGGTIVQQGGTLLLTATVDNDTSKAGVTWSIVGGGNLSAVTKTSATYNAPTGIVGSVSPILTVTSVADHTQVYQALLLVQGTPVMDDVVLFPGYLTSLYSAQVSVSGGLGPYTWVVSGGALPPGITLGVSTNSFTTITGTPTALGNSSF